ncbi:MAG: hypothetical protein ABIO79_10740 [Ferruginibacter sp.]
MIVTTGMIDAGGTTIIAGMTDITGTIIMIVITVLILTGDTKNEL